MRRSGRFDRPARRRLTTLSGVYDIKTEGQVTGVLTKVAFTNPHGAMHLDVKNRRHDDGGVMTTGSANVLAGSASARTDRTR
jgi:hypothetical protein